MASLHVISLNVRGLRDRNKHLAIYKWFNDHKADVCFVQDTRFTENLTNTRDLYDLHNAESFHSHGDSFSREPASFLKSLQRLK